MQRAQAGEKRLVTTSMPWCRGLQTHRERQQIVICNALASSAPIFTTSRTTRAFLFSDEMNHYRDWPLLDELPPGWKFCRHAGSPVTGYAFAQSASVLKGGKTALVKITPPTHTTNENFK